MLDFLQYSFIQRAFLAGTFLALIAPLVGNFIILKRFSALADTLSHVSLLGVAIAVSSKSEMPTVLAVLITSIIGALIEKLRQTGKVFAESILAIIYATSIAGVALIISFSNNFNKNLSSYLFGSLVAINTNQVIWIITSSIIVLVIILVFYKQFFAISFDEDLAKVSGIDVNKFNYLLVFLASLVIAVSMQIVGALLIGSLMVIPVISSWQLGLSFKKSIFFAILISISSVWLGIFLAYYGNLATGATIVMVNLFFLVCSYLLGKIRSN